MTRRGFTLIEIILALSITMLLAVLVLEWVINTVRFRDEVEANVYASRLGPVILGLMERDLSAVFVYQIANHTDEDTGEAGTFFLGTDGGDEIGAEDSVHFVTAIDSFTRIGAKASDVTEVGWFVRPNTDDGAADGWMILYRREDFHLDDDPLGGGKAIRIYDRVVGFDLEYFSPPEDESELDALYDLSDPAAEWDDQEEDALPIAVRIRVWIDLSDKHQWKKSLDDRIAAGAVKEYRALVILPRYPDREGLAALPTPGGVDNQPAPVPPPGGQPPVDGGPPGG